MSGESDLYECSACKISFNNVDEHLQQYHEGSETMISEKTIGGTELADEEGTFIIKKNSDGKYECRECFRTYKSLKRFLDHLPVHGNISNETLNKLEEASPDDPAKMQCSVCNTIFESRKRLLLHFPIHRNVAEAKNKQKNHAAIAFNCSLCNRSMKNSHELKMHLKAHSENLNQSSKGDSDKSVAEKGKKSGKYPCQYCKKEFGRPHEKLRHERVHTGEKPYSCDLCGKTFRVTYCLSLHKRNVHSDERPYVCSFEGCQKRFKTQGIYNHHLNTHGTLKPFQCTFCPKAFKTSVQLAGHKNIHTKPFSCQVCSRPFATLYAVKIHMEVHRNQETSFKYSCPVCNAQYGRNFALSDHMKQAHPDHEIDFEEHYVIAPTDEIKPRTGTVENNGAEVYSLVMESKTSK